MAHKIEHGHVWVLCRYSMARAQAVVKLLWRLATVPETIELARATGLTLGQVLFQLCPHDA